MSAHVFLPAAMQQRDFAAGAARGLADLRSDEVRGLPSPLKPSLPWATLRPISVPGRLLTFGRPGVVQHTTELHPGSLKHTLLV